MLLQFDAVLSLDDVEVGSKLHVVTFVILTDRVSNLFSTIWSKCWKKGLSLNKEVFLLWRFTCIILAWNEIVQGYRTLCLLRLYWTRCVFAEVAAKPKSSKKLLREKMVGGEDVKGKNAK